MRSGAPRVHQVLAYLFLAGAGLQFFLAGLGVFGDGNHESDDYDAHRIVGSLLTLVALLLLIAALVGRVKVRASVTLFVLMIVQNVLAEVGDDASALAALHPLLGVVLLVLAHELARGRGLGVFERGGGDDALVGSTGRPRP